MTRRPRVAALLSAEMIARCFAPREVARIDAIAACRWPHGNTLTETGQCEAIEGAEIIITGWGTLPISESMLDEAPALKLMCHAAGSVKHLVSAEFVRRGIRVCSANKALAAGVAEFTFGLIIVSMKAVWQYNDRTREGAWDRERLLDWVCEPFGATVGIVGASTVGRRVVTLCAQLPLKEILVFDPWVTHEEAAAMGATKTDLDDLMRRSDVVSLHTPAIEATRHLINARNLALLRDKAVFINTARGMCVDESALIAELKTGRILACIDVTDPEPPAPDSPLYGLPNCILTPHIAGAVKQNALRQGIVVADMIEAFVQDRPLAAEVDLSLLDRLA